MSTFLEITEETLAEVSSYVRNQESLTVLLQSVSDTDLTFTVDDATALSRGIAEIGDELIYIKSVNKTAGTVEIMPGGRGFRGSTAIAHSVNAFIRNNPTFPRTQIKRAINDTIQGIDLVAIGSHTFTFDGVTYAYPLPTDFEEITGVSFDAVGPTDVWHLLKRYRVDRNFRVDGAPSTVRSAIVLLEAPMAGRDVRVQYTKYPSPLANNSDNFASTSGLPQSTEDVIRLGAMWRLVSTIDPGKVTAVSPSADAMDAPFEVGQSSSVARYLYQLFGVRLSEEKAKQQKNYLSIIQYAR
tara:strand:- start:113 stop:1006 length:894 start_codon:yes stop_codon:yes gene_type:complete